MLTLRQIIGGIAIFLGIIGFCTNRAVALGRSDFVEPVLFLLVLFFWFALSFITKVSMLFEKKWKLLNAVSIFLWILVLVVVGVVDPLGSTLRSLPLFYIVCEWFLIIGWFVLDIGDLVYQLRD